MFISRPTLTSYAAKAQTFLGWQEPYWLFESNCGSRAIEASSILLFNNRLSQDPKAHPSVQNHKGNEW